MLAVCANAWTDTFHDTTRVCESGGRQTCSCFSYPVAADTHTYAGGYFDRLELTDFQLVDDEASGWQMLHSAEISPIF